MPDKLNANVFLSVGSEEAVRYVQHTISMASFLRERENDDVQLQFNIIEGADHGRAFPISTLESLGWLASQLK